MKYEELYNEINHRLELNEQSKQATVAKLQNKINSNQGPINHYEELKKSVSARKIVSIELSPIDYKEAIESAPNDIKKQFDFNEDEGNPNSVLGIEIFPQDYIAVGKMRCVFG